MLFNSVEYLIFLPVVVAAYYLLGQAGRQGLLLTASFVFYSFWSLHHGQTWPERLRDLAFTDGLLLTTTLVDYSVARWLAREQQTTRRRWILAISMASNLTLLGVFKYANFLGDSFLEWFGVRPWPPLHVALPPGISFYTFMSMAYVIDVYRGELTARDRLLDFSVFVAYFPHLVAGPILRAKQLLPQMTVLQPFEPEKFRRGLALILWGMFLKVYLADPMSHIVQEVYAAPGSASGGGLLLATYAFAVQIYCDFAGYSDIAIGSSLLLGIRLPENFRSPYLSTSITDFWRRWHISLSSWLRDYLYIPLGGNRVGTLRTYANLMITMLLGGLWHGAGWHWLVWGGIHGLLLSVERATGAAERISSSVGVRVLRWLLTFHIVCLSWVFFRSQGISQACAAVRRIFTWAPGDYFHGAAPLVLLALMLLLDLGKVRDRWVAWAERRPAGLRWIVYAAAGALLVTFQKAANPEFIYFQF
jgi:D-alanyl-lipoteichoic acid acyltransferase DltB (MBOAT superfamily)